MTMISHDAPEPVTGAIKLSAQQRNSTLWPAAGNTWHVMADWPGDRINRAKATKPRQTGDTFLQIDTRLQSRTTIAENQGVGVLRQGLNCAGRTVMGGLETTRL